MRSHSICRDRFARAAASALAVLVVATGGMLVPAAPPAAATQYQAYSNAFPEQEVRAASGDRLLVRSTYDNTFEVKQRDLANGYVRLTRLSVGGPGFQTAMAGDVVAGVRPCTDPVPAVLVFIPAPTTVTGVSATLSRSACGSATTLAVDGGLIAVGSPTAGTVSIYERPSAGWSGTIDPTVTLTAPVAGKRFGSSIAVAGDFVTVAAPDADAAYVYRKPLDGWRYAVNPTATLRSPAPETTNFGTALAAFADGGTSHLLVGAPPALTGERGAAHYYALSLTTSGEVTTPVASLVPPDGVTPGLFGRALALDERGALVARGTDHLYEVAGPPAGWRGAVTTASSAVFRGSNWGTTAPALHRGRDVIVVPASCRNSFDNTYYSCSSVFFTDTDEDGRADSVDNCAAVANGGWPDADADGAGDACDADLDGDAFANTDDNCPAVANPDQADRDGDGSGDPCDQDRDDDGTPDLRDRCPDIADPQQTNTDGDTQGDACDADDDNDGVNDVNSSGAPLDNCRALANRDQADIDGDRSGDPCDDDEDGDGLLDRSDPCPRIGDGSTADADRDGIGDACDFGNALRLFAGHASVPDSAELSPGAREGFTVEATFYGTPRSTGYLVNKEGSYALRMQRSDNGLTTVAFTFTDSAGTVRTLAGDVTMSPGPHHLAAVLVNRANLSYDSAGLFFDGRIVRTASNFRINGVAASTSNLTVGAGSADDDLVGSVDEVRLSAEARYTAEFGPLTGPLANDRSTIALWRFDEPLCATSFPDVSGTRVMTSVGKAWAGPAGQTSASVQFSRPSVRLPEGVGTKELRIFRAGDPARELTVSYASSPGTADDGDGSASGTVTLGCGQATALVATTIEPDAVYEAEESFTISLTGVAGGGPGAPSTMAVAIADDDPQPVVQFRYATRSVSELGPVATVAVVRSANLAGPVGVAYRTIGGSATTGADYVSTDGVVEFGAGETRRTIEVALHNDAVGEPGESFSLSLAPYSGGAAIGPTATSTLTILPSDQLVDGAISSTSSTGGYAGDDIYNTTAADQIARALAPQGRAAPLWVAVENEGTATNRVVVTASPAPAGTTLRFFDGSSEVTSSVLAARGYAVALAPGESKVIRVTFGSAPSTAVGTYSATIGTSWSGDAPFTDNVRAVLKVTRAA